MIAQPQDSKLLVDIAHQWELEVAERLQKFEQLCEPFFDTGGVLLGIYDHNFSLRLERFGSTKREHELCQWIARWVVNPEIRNSRDRGIRKSDHSCSRRS